jgi:hypothetical protein
MLIARAWDNFGVFEDSSNVLVYVGALFGDSDGDGFEDWKEIRAGTSKSNRAENLHVRCERAALDGGIRVQWPSVSSRWYAVHRAAGLVPGSFTNLQRFIQATPPLNTLTDSQASTWGSVFYRVELERTATTMSSDYDGDGSGDPASYVDATKVWQVHVSTGAATRVVPASGTGWLPVPGDYDGDGLTDIALYRPTGGLWVVQSGSGFVTNQWGWSAALPVAADYDGDGKTDLCVYNPDTGNWYIRQSSNLQQLGGGPLNWGWSASVPVVGDYDGDRKADIAVFDPSARLWYVRRSTDGQLLGGQAQQWGDAGAVPCPADFDGDGITDLAAYVPATGVWTIRSSATASPLAGSPFGWGWSASHPVPLDFDGDSRVEIAVHYKANSIWYIRGWSGQSVAGSPFTLPAAGAIPCSVQYNANRWFGLGPQ